MRLLLLILLFSGFLIPKLFAQDAPMSRRGKETFDKAQKAWQARQINEALVLFEKVEETDPNNSELHLRLAQIYELQKKTELTKKHFSKFVALRPGDPQSASAYQWLGSNLFRAEKYDSALVYFEKVIALAPAKSSLLRLAQKNSASALFAKNAIQHPVKVQKRSMGDTVNFLTSQFFPVMTADDETLIFTGLTENKDENIYITHRIPGGWDVPEEISKTINTPYNEGTCSISADGRTLVLTACNRADSYGGCDLYISKKQGNDWSAPQNLGETINSRNWESQPSLSADGRTLYFASDRRGGQGKLDIWYSILKNKDSWSEPKNLGPGINTPDDDNAPFIHANGRTLFFASNGLPGMGGFDIFLAQKTDTTWSAPRNIGYPINTQNDQVALCISANGKKAYYTDDNTDITAGRSLLYTFDLPDTLQSLVTPTRYVKGKIVDKKTQQPLSSSIELYDLKVQQKVAEFSSDPQTGSFLAVLNKGSEYAFYVSKAGYLFKSLTFSVTDSVSSINLEIPLESIEKDRAEILNNIFFNSGEFTLDDKSKVELDRMVDFLKNNKQISIEISGHTDDVGTDQVNLVLSKKRAQSVMDYLQKSGIDAARLGSKGYGEMKPMVKNDSEENRRKNRRIEWRVL